MPISRNTTHIGLIVAAAVLAACTQTPPQPPKPPPPETARYQAMPFEALPGWSRAALEPSLAWAGHADPLRGDVRGQLEHAADTT